MRPDISGTLLKFNSGSARTISGAFVQEMVGNVIEVHDHNDSRQKNIPRCSVHPRRKSGTKIRKTIQACVPRRVQKRVCLSLQCLYRFCLQRKHAQSLLRSGKPISCPANLFMKKGERGGADTIWGCAGALATAAVNFSVEECQENLCVIVVFS